MGVPHSQQKEYTIIMNKTQQKIQIFCSLQFHFTQLYTFFLTNAITKTNYSLPYFINSNLNGIDILYSPAPPSTNAIPFTEIFICS